MQKIKPDEKDTAARLKSAHKLLFSLVQIKQNTDIQFINDFTDEWDRFKLMFHVENYECQIEKVKQRKRDELRERLEKKAAGVTLTPVDASHDHGDGEHTHDHDHDHDEDDHHH